MPMDDNIKMTPHEMASIAFGGKPTLSLQAFIARVRWQIPDLRVPAHFFDGSTHEENEMTDEQKDKPKPGLLTEDSSVVSGTDKETGATVTRPKTADGKADAMTESTDRRENA